MLNNLQNDTKHYAVVINTPAQVEQSTAPIEWCHRHIGQHLTLWRVKACKPSIHQDTYWFVREQDAVLFALRWA